jgi:hypothetical protein
MEGSMRKERSDNDRCCSPVIGYFRVSTAILLIMPLHVVITAGRALVVVEVSLGDEQEKALTQNTPHSQ